jgi:pyridoxamine 5'-phosphate oxidase
MADSDATYRQAIERIQSLLGQAKSAGTGYMGSDPTMTLATAGADSRPRLRTVLLKGIDERGLVFYTNEHSRKGRDLAANPQAALLFFWPELKRQVNVEGGITIVADEESDTYWASRPRESQLGAWASHQSEPLASRHEYEQRLEALRDQYQDREVPRPPHWHGFRVNPDRIEFWHEGEFRQHERECYWRDEHGQWQWTLLNP